MFVDIYQTFSDPGIVTHGYFILYLKEHLKFSETGPEWYDLLGKVTARI